VLKPIIILDNLQRLYDRNEFLTAYQETKEWWQPRTELTELSVDELVLAARLATRLGGRRLWRWIFYEALKREPHNPKVRYFARFVHQRGWTLLKQIQTFPAQYELDSFPPELRVSYLASQGVLLASVRDFSCAHEYIRRAYAVGSDYAWAASCHADVLGMEDKWQDAIKPAEEAWAQNLGAPYAAHSLANALLHLGRIEESAGRLSASATQMQSYELAHIACWHQSALAETLDDEDRHHAALKARTLAEVLPSLAPLADREAKWTFARTHLDIAMLMDDQQEIERWAQEVKSPFHRAVLDNMKRATRRSRIRLSHRRTIQKHQACLPTSMVSVLSAFDANLDPDEIARQITFGGTADWAAAEWLERNGYVVRFFIATPQVAQQLISKGIPFVLTLEWDHNSHAVAVIGMDEGAGTLLVHDPQEFRSMEYLLDSLDSMRAPLGPRAMAAVPPEKAALLDGFLPAETVELMTAAMKHWQKSQEEDPMLAREIVARITENLPQHPGTKCLQAFQARDEGRTGVALQIFQRLYSAFPGSAAVRSGLMASYRSAGDSALLRSALKRIVDDGTIPGIEAQQTWIHPPVRYICEYADQLRQSAETADEAEKLLHSVLSRAPATAEAWHILADYLWTKHDCQAALLCYRFGSCLAPSYEHYAIAYCDALGNCGRKDQGLSWLEERARIFGHSSAAIQTWLSWIGALENWGYPERALAACEEALAIHAAQPEVLGFAVALFARMGDWNRAAKALDEIPNRESGIYLESAMEFHRMRGELDFAIACAEKLIEQAPGSTSAKRSLLDFIERRDGSLPTVKLAKEWLEKNTGNDYLEQLYLRALDNSHAPKRNIHRQLLKRLKRNPEDGWAWRDLTFRSLRDYQSAGSRQQPRIARRIDRYLAECERTASGEAPTLRVRAEWLESQSQWHDAMELWLRSIDHDPTHMYGHRHAIDCSSRFSAEQRWQVWQRMEGALRKHQGHWSNARDLVMLCAERYGVRAAEKVAWQWLELRPDDPEVIEAAADLLLAHGHGRSDAHRALDLLSSATQRFPFHFGLRFSLSDAHRDVGNFPESERMLEDIQSRHPDNSAVKMRLALVRERHGRIDEAMALLAKAAANDPRDSQIVETRAGILIRAGRLSEARTFIVDWLQKLREDVGWRKSAISLLMDCGDEDAAVAAARDGVGVYPDGAYMWMILGETLNRLPSHAAPGEVEECFRRSVELNRSLFEAADWLSYLLAGQRHYSEAEQVMNDIAPRLPNPYPAQGRIAWIRRCEAKRAEALEQMTSVVKAAPWYSWGWSIVIGWLEEDLAWERARALLASTPEEMRTNTEFRRNRLSLLAKAGVPAKELDVEWNTLLEDFPEDVPLHLLRHDSLKEAKRFAEAMVVLDSIEPVASHNPYFLARRVETHARASHKEQAISLLLRLFFMEVEENIWPVEHAWESIKNQNWGDAAYLEVLKRMEAGDKPTPRALLVLANHAAGTSEQSSSRRPVPLVKSLFPPKPARELRRLSRIVSEHPDFGLAYQAILLGKIISIGQQRLAVRYWNLHHEELRESVECWSQLGRALIDLGRKARARALMQDWRQRRGLRMWMISNYILCFSSLSHPQLEELANTCTDALAGLPHDHCAKYLVYRLAEANALLGRRDELRQLWERYRNYFDGKIDQNEYFRLKDRFLVDQIPAIVYALRDGRGRDYRKAIRSLRRQRYLDPLPFRLPTQSQQHFPRWLLWVLFWILLMIISQFSRNSQ